MNSESLSTATVKVSNSERLLHFRPNTSDWSAIHQIYKNREYDLGRLRRADEIRAFVDVEQGVGMQPLIVDAGANIGASAVYFALAFPHALVVAIEPEENNFALLRQNTEGLRVHCMQAALASAPGKAKVVDPGEGHWGYRTLAATDDMGINCVTIPDIFEGARPRFPFIVKIDIEGGESDVFSKNTGWVERTPIIIVELHDWLLPKGDTSRSFLRCIADQPRDFIIIGENIFSISHSLREAAYGHFGSLIANDSGSRG